LNKIIKSLLLILSLFILFYLLTLTYSFTNIYLSFKQENHINLQNFIDKKKISTNFKKQLNTIIYEKVQKEALLKIIYSLDEKTFDIFINDYINKLSDYLSDEKILISLYKNPEIIKNQIDSFKLKQTQILHNSEVPTSPTEILDKKKFHLVGPNIKELYNDTNFFFFTSLENFMLDFSHKDINIIIKLNLDKVLWKISSVEIKF
tara:strand:+ start:383 stop:997 length:615 start_codon:yes stop_codon:yes gene_type:complete